MGILIALAGDPEPGVRAAAARVIADRAGDGQVTAQAQLHLLVNDTGVQVAYALAAAVVDHPELAALDALQPLRSHISARVRAAVEGRSDSSP